MGRKGNPYDNAVMESFYREVFFSLFVFPGMADTGKGGGFFPWHDGRFL